MPTVTVFSAFNPTEAQLVRSRLEAAGFMATVTHEQAALGTEGWSTAIGGIRVEVPEEQAADAREVLAALKNAPPDESE